MAQSGKASFKVAQNLVKQGKVDEALVEYEKLLQVEPKNLQICYELADLYARRGLVSKVTDQYLRISDIYLGETSLDQGVEACYRIIRLEPESIKAREKLIEIYNQMENKDQVREQCFALSRICSMQGQSEKALEFLQKGIEVDPDNLDARLELAIMNVKQGHIKEGITQYKEVARAFWEKGELNKAADTYKRVTVLQPDDTETHLALGTLYRELGQLEDAKNAFRFILRYDLTHLKALTELGLVCQEKGEIDSAILAFRKIVDINPMKTEAREKLGELYEIRGQVQEAIKQYYGAAEDYHKEENFEKAIQMCEIILEIDCKHSKALRLMKELGYSGRPQAAPQEAAPAPQGRNNYRPPRANPSRPQSGIMMIPREGGAGRTRPLGPTGPRRVPFNQGATMRLGMGTHKLGAPPPLRKPRNSGRPLTPLKTMHDASFEAMHPGMDMSGQEPPAPPVMADREERVPRMEPPREVEEPRIPSSEELPPPGLARGEGFGGPQAAPKPRLISRRSAEPPEARQAEREQPLPSTGSGEKLKPVSHPAPAEEETLDKAFSDTIEEEKSSTTTKIGESDERDTALIAFSPDGMLEFDFEEDDKPVSTESVEVSEASVIPAGETGDPPLQEPESKPDVKEEEKLTSEPGPSSSPPPPEHAVIPIYT